VVSVVVVSVVDVTSVVVVVVAELALFLPPQPAAARTAVAKSRKTRI
jgi:hypothetical protein